MQLGPRAQQAQMQLGPSACVSCLAVLHAKVLRLLLLQVARNPTKHKRRQNREPPPCHRKRSLREELEIDARMHQGSCGNTAGHAERYCQLPSC